MSKPPQLQSKPATVEKLIEVDAANVTAMDLLI
jgi:hypothetical protein